MFSGNLVVEVHSAVPETSIKNVSNPFIIQYIATSPYLYVDLYLVLFNSFSIKTKCYFDV